MVVNRELSSTFADLSYNQFFKDIIMCGFVILYYPYCLISAQAGL